MCFFSTFLYIVASTLWQNFSRAHTVREYGVNVYPRIAVRCISAISLFLVLYLAYLTPAHFGVSNLQKLQVLVSIIAVSAIYPLFKNSTISVDHVSFIGFVIFSSLVLLLSNDLVIIFFTLELLNMLIIYSFFFNSNVTQLNPLSSALKISSSCVYQFILNFFSSILLYVSINWYMLLTGGSSLYNASVWQLNVSTHTPVSLILLCFLLKLGSGPWIFFKITIYKNMNYVSVYLYTAVYLTVILVFFFNLIFTAGLSVHPYTSNFIVIISAAAVIVFSSLSFQTNNFFVFLSFSSLINITVFLLQVMSVMFVWIAQE